MNKYFFIFLSFSALALLVVGFSFYASGNFSASGLKAEGFGVAPPYFQNNNLKPGDVYTQSILILRSEAMNDSRALIDIHAPAIKSWLKIEPDKIINLQSGNYRTPFRVKLVVPKNAKSGKYKGYMNVIFLNNKNLPGVGISIGARIDINIEVK
jgi:hypothetical protein